MEVGLGPGDLCVRWGPSSPQKKGTPTRGQFLSHVYCGQTAGWMKAPLGTEVDLGPGHIVLDGVPSPRERGTAPHPSFRPMSIVATVAHLSYCCMSSCLILGPVTSASAQLRFITRAVQGE